MLKRKFALQVGSWISDVKEIDSGLPQSSALLPVLFNVYTVGITYFIYLFMHNFYSALSVKHISSVQSALQMQ